MSIRNPIVRQILGAIFALAGLGYLAYARFGHFNDPNGDNQRIVLTVGIAFLVLGPVFALTGRRGETGGMAPEVSGIRLVAVSAILFGLGFLFNNKAQTYLMVSLWLTAAVLGLIGITRLLSAMLKRR